MSRTERAISDAGWYKFRELLRAKCDRYNRHLVVIDRWEATSQKCSNCGFNGGKKELNVREWNCWNCGTAHDRDICAALNIQVAGGRSETINRRGRGCQSTSVANLVEPSTTYHKYSNQALLIKELNPIIRGWTNYYQFSNAQTVGELTRQDYLLFQKLRAWSRHRTGDWYKARRKYWTKIGNNNWVFATRHGDANPLRLLTHTQFGSSGSEYVKVKGEDSPFNGNLVYWSTRMGKHPNLPTRKASLLKRQKGRCSWCCLHFREEDVLEVDHILATSLGGKDKYSNLQLLHGHCHDQKTALEVESPTDKGRYVE